MKWIFVAITLMASPTQASWFEPASYADCITESMKGVTSDVAAVEIKKACRAKFPLKRPTVSTISGSALESSIAAAKLQKINAMFSTAYSSADYKLTFHNQLDLTVSSITIAVLLGDGAPRIYKESCNTAPLSAGTCFLELNLTDGESIKNWHVQSIEVVERLDN